MELLRFKFYLGALLVVYMINLGDCNKIRKIEHSLSALKEQLATLENKVYEKDVTLLYEIEQIWRLLNSSNGGLSTIQDENEADDQNVKMDTIENVVKQMEERSKLLIKGFTTEKSELRKRAEDFNKEIEGLKNQQIIALSNFTNMADEFMSKLDLTVGDKLNQINSDTEKCSNQVMKRHVDDFAKLNKSLNEQFIGFKTSMKELNKNIVISLKQSEEMLEVKHNDLVNSLSLKANKFNSDIEVKVKTELEKVRKAKEVTESKTVQLEAMIKNVNDFDEIRKKIETLEKFMLQETCLKENGVKFESSCYVVSSAKATWKQAVDACSKMGARLVKVNSDSEKDFLLKHRSVAKPFWVASSEKTRHGPICRVIDNGVFYSMYSLCSDFYPYICEFTL